MRKRMRIAVSDYDGTLLSRGSVSIKNIEAISAWRKAGNVFGIATGRDLCLVMHDINQWKIPFDFLVCMNGAILYDSELRILKSKNIPDSLIKDILQHPAALVSMHYQLCSDGQIQLYIRSDASWFRGISASFKEITLEESLLQSNIQQISLAYETETEYKKCADALLADYKDKLSLNLNNYCIDINDLGVNKLTGILELLAIKGWPSEGLLTIGDAENDLSMIRHFRGFSVYNAHTKVVNEAAAVYDSVGSMLMDNM